MNKKNRRFILFILAGCISLSTGCGSGDRQSDHKRKEHHHQKRQEEKQQTNQRTQSCTPRNGMSCQPNHKQ